MSTLTFHNIGPFDLPLERRKRVSRELRSLSSLLGTEFWSGVKKEAEKANIHALEKREGIYIFGLRNQNKERPFYVGKAGRVKLGKEPFTASKITKYEDALADNRGTPFMYFCIMRSRQGKFNEKILAQAERFLIEKAFAVNPDKLLNNHHAKEQKWSIPGLVRSSGRGRLSSSSLGLREMLGEGS